MTTNQRILIGTCIWGSRIIALAMCLVAIGETVQLGLCLAQERRK
jgi:hypothetical protein